MNCCFRSNDGIPESRGNILIKILTSSSSLKHQRCIDSDLIVMNSEACQASIWSHLFGDAPALDCWTAWWGHCCCHHHCHCHFFHHWCFYYDCLVVSLSLISSITWLLHYSFFLGTCKCNTFYYAVLPRNCALIIFQFLVTPKSFYCEHD